MVLVYLIDCMVCVNGFTGWIDGGAADWSDQLKLSEVEMSSLYSPPQG